jgi:hypothetical protein
MKKIIRQRAAESSDRSSRREQLARRLSGERAGPWKRSKPLFSYIDGHLIGLRAVYVHHPDGCLGYPSISGLQTVRSVQYSLPLKIAETCLPQKIYLVEKDVPLDVDAGFLTITDPNPIDKESYEYVPYPNSPTKPYKRKNSRHDREAYLQSTRETASSSSRSALQPADPLLARRPPRPTPTPNNPAPPHKPLPKPKPKPNGSASRTRKVSSPSGARRTYRTTSGRRGSRAGGGKARTGRRRHSDCTRYLPTLVRCASALCLCAPADVHRRGL